MLPYVMTIECSGAKTVRYLCKNFFVLSLKNFIYIYEDRTIWKIENFMLHTTYFDDITTVYLIIKQLYNSSDTVIWIFQSIFILEKGLVFSLL